eukprot:3713813-Pyramimonas_sp.AAC.1
MALAAQRGASTAAARAGYSSFDTPPLTPQYTGVLRSSTLDTSWVLPHPARYLPRSLAPWVPEYRRRWQPGK